MLKNLAGIMKSVLLVSIIGVLLGRCTPGITPVVILVIDDFDDKPLEREQIRKDISRLESENCVFTLNEQGNYAIEGVGNYAIEGVQIARLPISHGDLVFTELSNLIDENGSLPETGRGSEIFPEIDWLKDIELWKIRQEKYILLVGVDTDGFGTSAVASNIEDAIALFSSEDELAPLGYT